MSALSSLTRAIAVRQYERQRRCEPPMEEMWIDEYSWEAVKDDLRMFMTIDDSAHPETCMGVRIRVIGT